MKNYYLHVVMHCIIWLCASKHTEVRCTFFPIPLVGDGAGDTGTKSMRFGDEDADFSKSLSLYEHTFTRHIGGHFILRHISIVLCSEVIKKKKKIMKRRVWEYYTTNSV